MKVAHLHILFVFASVLNLAWAEPTFIPGTSQKICQLTGDVDRETGLATRNRTESRFGVAGTDLGFSFEHHGNTFFLFGDTVSRHDLRRRLNEDAIGYTPSSALKPSTCIDLEFITQAKDGGYLPPKLANVSNGTFEVPTAGVSANDKMYVWFTEGSSPEKLMHRSYLGVSPDEGKHFTKLGLYSAQKFINVNPVKVLTNSLPDLEDHSDSTLLVFGSGWYRKSDIYLSAVAEKNLEFAQHYRYFAGLDAKTQAPLWTNHEAGAKSLFHQPCIGEFSVAFAEDLKKWVMLYNCDQNRGINLRLADRPWGPWSKPQIIFEPNRDHAYGKFMHVAHRNENEKVDSLSDPGQESDFGGEYGPFLIPKLFSQKGNEFTLAYTLSIHNPYQVILMQTQLRLDP